MASVGELFVSLGFDVDSKALDQFDQGIKNLSSNMLELLGIAGVSAYGVNKFITGAMDGAQTMTNLAQGTRLAVDELQKYAAVTNILNPKISADSAAGAISDLDKRLNDWRLGLADGAPLGAAAGRAGISIGNMNAIQFLDALREKFPNIDPTLQSGILRQAGLPNEFMNVLNASPQAFNKIAESVGLTKNELDKLAESSRELNKVFVQIYTGLEKALAFFLNDKPSAPYKAEDFKKGIGQEWNDFIHKDVPDYFKNKGNSLWTSGKNTDGNAPSAANSDDLSDIVGGKRNNPGNVTDGKTVRQFSTLAEGYQATSNLLLRYQQKGWDTIDKIIEHWAPYKDASGRVINPATGSGNYQNYLANLLHVDRNAHLDFANNPTLLRAFIKDQSQFEHGAQGSKISNNVTIYNRGEVRPETWASYTVQSYQNTIMQINNPATA